MHDDSALLLIEFQNEWLSSEGKLHHLFQDKALLEQALEQTKIAMQQARNNHVPIIYTAMGCSSNYAELGQTDFGLRGAIPVAKTWQEGGELIHPNFAPEEQDYVISNKKGGSAFAHTDLDLYLRTHNIKRLYIAGFALHVCVLATAWSAHDLGYEVVILEDAVAAFTREQQAFVLHELLHHCAKTMKTIEFTKILSKGLV